MRLDLDFLSRHRGLVAVTALQALCGLYFVLDVLTELPELRTEPMHPLTEIAAVIALLIGSALGLRQLRLLIRRNDRVENQLRAARGAFGELMKESFARWGLTPSERDVALLSIKGLSVAEIAAMRATQTGTVKAQCAAVYRKAGVNSRAELLSLFIDDLMGDLPLAAPPKAAEGASAPSERRPAA